MTTALTIDKDYLAWLSDIKAKIRSARVRAAVAANAILIRFYYDLGRMITEKQAQTAWGDKLIDRLAKDLRTEFPEMQGFSRSNLLYCKQFFNYFQRSPKIASESVPPFAGPFTETGNRDQGTPPAIVPQSVGQSGQDRLTDFLNLVVFNIPWGHIRLIIGQVKDMKTAMYYFAQTLQNGWSRDVLAFQIKSNLYKRQGKAVTNFSLTLPEPLSDLAQQALKDPYVFDFVSMAEPYHVQLKCYVVMELKNTKFIPEYAGKLNFYISAVDTLLKREDDKPTIGILLCREKTNVEAEFALRDIQKPIGVSEIALTDALPENLRSSLPSVEELETELNRLGRAPSTSG